MMMRKTSNAEGECEMTIEDKEKKASGTNELWFDSDITLLQYKNQPVVFSHAETRVKDVQGLILVVRRGTKMAFGVSVYAGVFNEEPGQRKWWFPRELKENLQYDDVNKVYRLSV
jgi:hypothetical protein